MRVIFLFIDGVGLGKEHEANPFFNHPWNEFTFMSGGQPFTEQADDIRKEKHLFTTLDATLGVEGLPQSGTGQATLFSGENAAREIGKHFGPFPHSGIKHLLREKSLFNKAQSKGKNCSFINAYPDIFFQKARARNRWSCTTLMARGADISLNTTEEVKQGKAITAGITQEEWRKKLNLKVSKISPETAARRLINQSVNYNLLLHEYYLTDKAGHSQDIDQAKEVIRRYERFLSVLIKEKPEQTTLVLSSDHGNVENMATKTHTLNRVPLFVFGPGALQFKKAQSIIDVTPGILEIL